jgi:hypothetical protein
MLYPFIGPSSVVLTRTVKMGMRPLQGFQMRYGFNHR